MIKDELIEWTLGGQGFTFGILGKSCQAGYSDLAGGFELIKSNLLFHWLYYAEECKELVRSTLKSLRPGNTAPFEEILHRWQAVGNTVYDLTGLRFEPQTSSCRDKCVTARTTGWSRGSPFCKNINPCHL